MPAQRTRCSKRGDRRHTALTSNPSVDPPTTPLLKNISFAPTVTPGTFFDPPEPIEPPPESLLFPPSPEVPITPKRRGGHTKKKPEDHIPRPPNAFILFRSSFIKNQHVSSEIETNHSTLSKIIGLTWQNLPHEEKQIWHARAKLALQEHKKKFPQYAFRPAHTKGKSPEKRKVREVGPKDTKRCAKIAELLVEGKRGAELDAAIAEFDRHHVPEIVTRFEAPITARTYRRSSSAPVEETEHSKPSFLVPTKGLKPRASSSQPPESSNPKDSSDLGPEELSLQWPESDADASSEYSYDMISIPASPCELSPNYSLPDTNPVFDFSSFSFAATSSASQQETLDPLSAPRAQQDVFDPFNDYVRPPAPSSMQCSPRDDVFGSPLNLTINTSFYCTDSYSDSPSPMSSMPSTPQSSENFCFSMYGSDTGLASPMPSFNSTYDYFPTTASYSDSVAPGCSTAVQHAVADSGYYSTPTADFAYFDKSTLGTYSNGLASPFVPTYTM